MKGTRFSQERIIGILKEADCKTSNIGELCGKHGVSEQTFYRWLRKYGGFSVSEARRQAAEGSGKRRFQTQEAVGRA